MTIAAATVRSNHIGAGNAHEYDYDFRIFSETDLLVTVRDTDDVETQLVLDTDYTVDAFDPDDIGGGITLVDDGQAWLDSDGDLLTGYVISIRRVRPITQLTDISNSGPFAPSIHENAFDHFVMIDQQQQDEIDRSMRLPETVDPEDVAVELPVPSADKLIGWNSDATALENKANLSGYTGLTSFAESLIDDPDAATARTTLDVSRAIASLTEETSAAQDDYLPIRDTSEPADNKLSLSNLLKFALSLSAAGKAHNLGIVAGTTTIANDSIKVQGAAAALSATNPLHIAVPHSTTPGLLSVLSLTSDVTIKVTGAHWGMGTKGDFTDVELRVYAINDGSGTLKFGLTTQGGLRSIASTATSATPTDVDTQPEMLVNAALAVGTWPCVEVGWAMASFDDTGGAAEDLWAVTTSLGKIGVGTPVKDRTDWESWTPTGSWTANTTYTGRRRRRGDTKEYEVLVATSGAPTSADLTITLPVGDRIDTTKLCGTAQPSRVGQVFGLDSGTGSWTGLVEYSSTSVVGISCVKTESLDNANVATVTQARPQTFANNDKVHIRFEVPLLGLSSN